MPVSRETAFSVLAVLAIAVGSVLVANALALLPARRAARLRAAAVLRSE